MCFALFEGVYPDSQMERQSFNATTKFTIFLPLQGFECKKIKTPCSVTWK